MAEYTIECWCRLAKHIVVKANSEGEAKDLAWEEFENCDLNKCDLCDYGREVVSIES